MKRRWSKGRARSTLSARLEHLIAHGVLGRTGRLIEPAVRPLGWDWRIGMAALASFPACEVVVFGPGRNGAPPELRGRARTGGDGHFRIILPRTSF